MSKVQMDSAFDEFFTECEEILQRVSLLLGKAESGVHDQEMLDSLYRDIHTLKGSSQLFGFQAIGLIAHAIEATLEPVRQNKVKLDKAFIDFIYKGLDQIDLILKNPQRELQKDPSLQAELIQTLPQLVALATQKFNGDFNFFREALPDASTTMEELARLKDLLAPAPKEEPITKVQATPAPQSSTPVQGVNKMTTNLEKTSTSEEAQGESSTIRVQVGLLDKLMNLVGEMVLTRNQVLQYARSSEDNDFLSLTQRLDLVTTELQDNVMKTRMQPIGTIFNKFQRVVRDLSRDLGKNIDLVINGAETELDKSLIEAIKDPLTHIVRNSCDHGIETPSVRKEQGKPDTGTLNLRAYHEGGQVIIEIEDDGRGIDPAKVKQKAIEKRIITADRAQVMSDKEAQELIFAAGFSTAEQVTSVSGRGVGMDVVRNNIEKVGGIIELDSSPGKGTSLRLKIPLTLAIVPAMIIRSGEDHFAIPQVKLQELLRVDMEDAGSPKVEKLQGQDVFRLRGQLLPLVSCDEIMNPGKGKKGRTVYHIVVLKGEPHPYGLIVDEICDTADIVVKPLPSFLKKMDMFSGATIMGDGSVALIADTVGIADHMKVSQRANEMDKKAKAQAQSQALARTELSETTEFLFFKLNHPGLFAIPLVLVNRLEEFAAKDVEYSGEERLVKYRESLLPLISINEYLGYPDQTKDIDPAAKVSVIVVMKNNRLFGLMINEVVDILSSTSEITAHIKKTKGLLGTIISSDKSVVTIIDTYGIIAAVTGIELKTVQPKKLRKARVLFAEDTIFFVKQVKKVLEKAGLEVTHAPDGAEALKLLKAAGPGGFDLVISDIEMPNMNGFTLAQNIRAEGAFQNLPLIALTTRFRESDQEKGKEVGFNRYLEKLKSDELIEAIMDIQGI